MLRRWIGLAGVGKDVESPIAHRIEDSLGGRERFRGRSLRSHLLHEVEAVLPGVVFAAIQAKVVTLGRQVVIHPSEEPGKAADRVENRVTARQLALQCTHQLATQPLTRHLGFPGDVWSLVDHLARLGDDLLARLQVDADAFEIVTLDLVLQGLSRNRRGR